VVDAHITVIAIAISLAAIVNSVAVYVVLSRRIRHEQARRLARMIAEERNDRK
jgi:cobalamin biosynthesis protein CobD/CbiB